MSKSCCGPTAKEEMIGGFEKWKVEGWLSSLMSAEDIYGDKKKLKAIQTLLKAKQRDTNDIESRVQAKLNDTFGEKA
jgi:hypothetical protein